jgi:hypothetical protein
MASNHPFLGVGADIDLVLQWFENTGEPFRLDDRLDAIVIHFFGMGPLVETEDRKAVQHQSPLVWIVKPKLIRRCLWTSGEVIFTPTPLKEIFPDLQKMNRRLAKWFQGFPLAYTHKKPNDSEWSYYLEGSLKNWDGKLYALPAAYDSLRQGQYFVHHGDASGRLDGVCGYLRLRGVDVSG